MLANPISQFVQWIASSVKTPSVLRTDAKMIATPAKTPSRGSALSLAPPQSAESPSTQSLGLSHALVAGRKRPRTGLASNLRYQECELDAGTVN